LWRPERNAASGQGSAALQIKGVLILQKLDTASIAEAQPISFDLDSRTEKLSLIADWKDELRLKLARAVNDVWGPLPDLDELHSEVERFKLACEGVRQ